MNERVQPEEWTLCISGTLEQRGAYWWASVNEFPVVTPGSTRVEAWQKALAGVVLYRMALEQRPEADGGKTP